MALYLEWEEAQRYSTLVEAMHADRKKVFIDTLKWDLPHDGVSERDQFDTSEASYLILQNGQIGDHLCSVRLLDTCRPHILGSIFPQLCEGAVPRGPTIREITRFCASPRYKAAERLRARNMMARALIELGHREGITAYTAVCDLGFLTQVLAAGWRCQPLGMPQPYEGGLIGAFMIFVDDNSLDLMTSGWRWDRPVLTIEDRNAALAA